MKRPTPCWLKMIKMAPRFMHLSVLRMTEFKFNFFTYITLYIASIFLFLYLWQNIKIPAVEGWQKEHYILLIGFSVLNYALQEILWSTSQLDLFILEGDLLVVLSRPLNSYFGLVMRRLGTMAVLPAFMGVVLIFWTISRYEMSVESWRLVAALTTCIVAAVMFRAIMVAIGSLSFRFGRVGSLKSLVLGTREYTRFSLSILNPHISSILTFVLPAIAISTWPTLILDIASPRDCFIMLISCVLLSIFWVLFACWAWTHGLRRYEGTGRWA